MDKVIIGKHYSDILKTSNKNFDELEETKQDKVFITDKTPDDSKDGDIWFDIGGGGIITSTTWQFGPDNYTAYGVYSFPSGEFFGDITPKKITVDGVNLAWYDPNNSVYSLGVCYYSTRPLDSSYILLIAIADNTTKLSEDTKGGELTVSIDGVWVGLRQNSSQYVGNSIQYTASIFTDEQKSALDRLKTVGDKISFNIIDYIAPHIIK